MGAAPGGIEPCGGTDPIGGMDPDMGGIEPCGGTDPPGGMDADGGTDPIEGMDPDMGGTLGMGGMDPIGGTDWVGADGGGDDPIGGIKDGRLASTIEEAATIWANLAIPDPGSSSLSCTRPSPSPLMLSRSARDILSISSFFWFESSFIAVISLPFSSFQPVKRYC